MSFLQRLSSALILPAGLVGCAKSPATDILLAEAGPAASGSPSLEAAGACSAEVAAPPQELIGTVAPLVFSAAAPDGSWQAYCQARRDTDRDGELSVEWGRHGDAMGDDLSLYVNVRGRPEEEWDRILAVSPNGRHIAGVRLKRLVVLDTVASLRVDLSARGAAPVAPWPAQQVASFSDNGKWLLYLGGGRQKEAVVHDVYGGTEHRVRSGPGVLWTGWLGRGDRVILQVVAEDTNHNGRLEVPELRTTLADPRCRGPVGSSTSFWGNADEPQARVGTVQAGEVSAVPELIGELGTGLLRFGTKGEVLVRERDGQETTLLEERCNATLAEVDSDEGTLLATCGPTEGLQELLFVKRGEHIVLGVKLKSHYERWRVSRRGRHVLVLPNEGTPLVLDLATGDRIEASEDWQLLASYGDTALILKQREPRAVLLRIADNKEMLLRQGVAPDTYAIQTDATVALVEPSGPSWVASLSHRCLLGKTAARALAVTRSGQVLISTAAGVGPMYWVAPSQK